MPNLTRQKHPSGMSTLETNQLLCPLLLLQLVSDMVERSGRCVSKLLHVGQLEADLDSPDRLHVIDWTPFVNQLDPLLYSDTRSRE
jgi:hypothetical protein